MPEPDVPTDSRGSVKVQGDVWDRFTEWQDSRMPHLKREHLWTGLARMIVELDDPSVVALLVDGVNEQDRAMLAHAALSRIASGDTKIRDMQRRKIILENRDEAMRLLGLTNEGDSGDIEGGDAPGYIRPGT